MGLDNLHERRTSVARASQFDQAFHFITQQLADDFGAAGALVNLVGVGQAWFKSLGMGAVADYPVTAPLCGAFFLSDIDFLVVEDTLTDPRYARKPGVVGKPFIRFYAGRRLKMSGRTVGTLCIHHTRPMLLSSAQHETLRDAAESVADLLAVYPRPPGDGAPTQPNGISTWEL